MPRSAGCKQTCPCHFLCQFGFLSGSPTQCPYKGLQDHHKLSSTLSCCMMVKHAAAVDPSGMVRTDCAGETRPALQPFSPDNELQSVHYKLLLMFRGQPSKGVSPMERFMRAEEQQLQADQDQSTAEDDLSPLMPVASDAADMNGCLLSQKPCDAL